jgi:hypothetical protein
MSKRLARPAFLLTFSLLAGLFTACSDDPTEPVDDSPLAGLAQREGKDSTGNPLPPPPTNPTPGSFHGTVLGPSVPGTVDTLATAPRIADVVVKAFKITGGTQADPELGPVEQTVTTGADGKFSLTLSGGDYVVTFTPAESSSYGGVWVTAATSATSNDYPWWVILWKKN